MNANSRPPMPTIKDWLANATSQLNSVDVASARLDAEIILAHTLKEPRTHLHAHADELIDERSQEIADARLALRLDRVPVAYIIGHKEFYGRKFKVTTATLIPRPESETIINIFKDLMPKNQALFTERKRLIDIGTGSGCLGITIKLEIPELDVTLSDISAQALKVAESNAKRLQADVTIIKSDLLSGYPFDPDIIIANLPYVDSSWDRSPETQFEPEMALFATNGGTALINKLIIQASTRLTLQGLLLLEADPEQHEGIIRTASSHGLTCIRQQDYIVALKRA